MINYTVSIRCAALSSNRGVKVVETKTLSLWHFIDYLSRMFIGRARVRILKKLNYKVESLIVHANTWHMSE